jgi:protein-tyrosine-phosphatase
MNKKVPVEISEKDKILARLKTIDQEIDDMKEKKMSYLKIRHKMFERLDLVFALERSNITEAMKQKIGM